MRKLLFLLFIIPFFSCRTLNPSVMFESGNQYTFPDDSVLNQTKEYLIANEDHLDMKIFTNDGFRLVDVTQSMLGINQLTYYVVEPDGLVKLPLIGRVSLRGLNIHDAEKFLEEKYATYFVTPYVMLRVTSRQVLVFPGDGGTGVVISLQNENTTLLEALTVAGGVKARGKAYKIKLIRGDPRNPKVYLVDLSTIEGMKKSNMTVQSKDIIYVEPSPEYSSKVLSQITPYVSILTTVLLVVNLLKK
ncbi:MAG: polysaccharide biosynthesis/export family protein [Bacteroidetes bacterium]|nr:polysaccharide biosynthesis/export family protein [Bacteroidota bacterium]